MSKDQALKPCTSCKTPLTTANSTFNGVQETPDSMDFNLNLHTCNSCHSTVAMKVPKTASKTPTETQKSAIEDLEELAKSCPRCGGKSANSSNPSGRCSACLKKLAVAKKKPGSWQRAQTKADDALRRQKGKNGTASKKSSGLGNRKSIVKQTQSAEKKTGEKLSPDRKNNAKGYASSNTRMVPEKLNRGRHHVDEKKLRNWKKKLKKSELTAEQLYVLIKAKYINDEAVSELIKGLGPEGLEQYIDLFDIEGLDKSVAPKLEPTPAPKTGLAGEVGKTHTVEIHPDIDHLYRAKGLMLENKKDKLHINEYKKAGFSSNLTDKMPKDAKGFVTPEAIDQHIASLPKTKVNLRVLEGKNRPGEQKHRVDAPEYTLSLDMHPEEKMKMSPKLRNAWNGIKRGQHSWEPRGSDKGLHNLDQVGWVRVDPNKASQEPINPVGPQETAHGVSNGIRHRAKFEEHPHWHIDEIQSDFQNPNKLDRAITTNENSMDAEDPSSHPDYRHMLHNVNSDIDEGHDGQDNPTHQAYQNGVSGAENDFWSQYSMEDVMWPHNNFDDEKAKLADGSHEALKDPHFKSAFDKLGVGAVEHLAHWAGRDSHEHRNIGDPESGSKDIIHAMNQDENPQVKAASTKFKDLSDAERKAIGKVVASHADRVEDTAREQYQTHLSNHMEDSRRQWVDEHIADKIKEKEPDYFKIPQEDLDDKDKKDLLNHLSHGHDDPQHALHSAVNALGRKLGVKSMSMDTPEDQAKKSALVTEPKQDKRYLPAETTWDGWHRKLNRHLKSDDYKADPEAWKSEGQPLVEQISNENPDFKAVADKLGPSGMESMASLINKNDDGWMYEGGHNEDGWNKGVHHDNEDHPELNKETKTKLQSLSSEEKDELSSFMNMYRGKTHEAVAKKIGLPERPDINAPTYELIADEDQKAPPLPVHQINTYNKRAKKLGMKHVDKKQILGDHPQDKTDHQIQYMNLHKKLQQFKDYMAELKKAKN